MTTEALLMDLPTEALLMGLRGSQGAAMTTEALLMSLCDLQGAQS